MGTGKRPQLGGRLWAAASLTGLPAPESSLPLKIDYVQTVSVAIGTHLNTIQCSQVRLIVSEHKPCAPGDLEAPQSPQGGFDPCMAFCHTNPTSCLAGAGEAISMFSVQAANCFHAGSYAFIRSLGSFRGTRMMAVSGPGRVASVRAERKTKNEAGSLQGLTDLSAQTGIKQRVL